LVVRRGSITLVILSASFFLFMSVLSDKMRDATAQANAIDHSTMAIFGIVTSSR
jgi:hypothetical protein